MNKHLLTFLFINFFFFHAVFSNIWIVCNHRSEGSHYSSIQSAVEHADSNDTIYVRGSEVNYGNVFLEKPLVLVAEGALDDKTPLHSAKLTRILLTHNPYLRTVSSGSSIIGFEFPYFSGNRPNILTIPNPRIRIEDISIERNWVWFIEIPSAAKNWNFVNNIIRGWVNARSGTDQRHGGFEQFYFYNNIINSIKGFDNGSVYIYNNIITGRLQDVYGAKVINNIFTREIYVLDNASECIFKGNISVGAQIASDECYEPTNRFEGLNKCTGKYNKGSGNLVGVKPGFEFWPNPEFLFGSAFKLNSRSAALSIGINGQQSGIFGGLYPFPENAFRNLEMDDPFPTFITSIY